MSAPGLSRSNYLETGTKSGGGSTISTISTTSAVAWPRTTDTHIMDAKQQNVWKGAGDQFQFQGK